MNYDQLSRIRSFISLYSSKVSTNILDGEFRSIYKGRSLDFDELREYVTGDNVRDVDWKASSRTGKLLVRRYVAEKRHNVLFVVDSGRRMTADTSAGEPKSAVAVDTLGVIAYLVNQGSDEYALLMEGEDGLCFTNFGRGGMHFEGMMQLAEKNVTRAEADPQTDGGMRLGKLPLFGKLRERRERKRGKAPGAPGVIPTLPGQALPGQVPGAPSAQAGATKGSGGSRDIDELLNYAAENIRRRMIIVAITDLRGVAGIDESLIRKVTVNNDLLVICLDDALLTGGDVYDVENRRYESELLLGGDKLTAAERKARDRVLESAEKRFRSYRVSMLKLAREEEVIPGIIDLFARHRYAIDR